MDHRVTTAAKNIWAMGLPPNVEGHAGGGTGGDGDIYL